jgi:hypothetical protein
MFFSLWYQQTHNSGRIFSGDYNAFGKAGFFFDE